MNNDQLNKEKAAAIINFVDTIIGALDSGHVHSNTVTLAQLHRIAEQHCSDNYNAEFGKLHERHGAELAKKCGQTYFGDYRCPSHLQP
jgi:hypothetical protein